MADHGQLVHRIEGRRPRPRVAAGLQRRHQVQPRERDAGRRRTGAAPITACPTRPSRSRASTSTRNGADWRDQERDADGDGLNNWLESARGPSNNGWWQRFWANDKQFTPPIEPWADKNYCAGYGGPSELQAPGYYDQRLFADLDLADPDVDGDTLLDGEDDQDNDDVNNITELYETVKDGDLDGDPELVRVHRRASCPRSNFGGFISAINPFNPCAPNPVSRTCPDYKPF